MPDVLLAVPYIKFYDPKESAYLRKKIEISNVTNDTTVSAFKKKISNKIKIPIKYLTLVRSGRLFGGDTDLGEESTVLDAGYDVVRNTNRPPKLIINYTDYINDKKATTIQKRVRGNISRDESARWGYLTKEIKERKWSDIEKSLLKEGFDKESINQFKKDYYLGKSSKKRRITKRRKRRSTKRRKRRSTKRRSTKRRSTKRRSTKRRYTKRV